MAVSFVLRAAGIYGVYLPENITKGCHIVQRCIQKAPDDVIFVVIAVILCHHEQNRRFVVSKLFAPPWYQPGAFGNQISGPDHLAAASKFSPIGTSTSTASISSRCSIAHNRHKRCCDPNPWRLQTVLHRFLSDCIVPPIVLL